MAPDSPLSMWVATTRSPSWAASARPELEKILRKLEKAGFEIGGDRLKTTPRGYAADHPRGSSCSGTGR